MLTLTNNKLNPINNWTKPVNPIIMDSFNGGMVANFDQNGYDLSMVELTYAMVDPMALVRHVRDRSALFENWMVQEFKEQGAILNHSYLFQRRGFAGEAFEQLHARALHVPILFKPLKLRPKWGIDFSMDWVDVEGNVFEVLHWEWDGFNYDHVELIKLKVENKLIGIDWDHAGKLMLLHRDKWYHLSFFEQSDWKCNFFGIEREQFKMVGWE